MTVYFYKDFSLGNEQLNQWSSAGETQISEIMGVA